MLGERFARGREAGILGTATGIRGYRDGEHVIGRVRRIGGISGRRRVSQLGETAGGGRALRFLLY
ncbi:hypothetical protein D3C73_1625980 [compost metagenome]